MQTYLKKIILLTCSLVALWHHKLILTEIKNPNCIPCTAAPFELCDRYFARPSLPCVRACASLPPSLICLSGFLFLHSFSLMVAYYFRLLVHTDHTFFPQTFFTIFFNILFLYKLRCVPAELFYTVHFNIFNINK